ncbi:hypothetical protein Ciccas_009880, partial [Cichlidogyrus casuarinus]
RRINEILLESIFRESTWYKNVCVVAGSKRLSVQNSNFEKYVSGSGANRVALNRQESYQSPGGSFYTTPSPYFVPDGKNSVGFNAIPIVMGNGHSASPYMQCPHEYADDKNAIGNGSLMRPGSSSKNQFEFVQVGGSRFGSPYPDAPVANDLQFIGAPTFHSSDGTQFTYVDTFPMVSQPQQQHQQGEPVSEPLVFDLRSFPEQYGQPFFSPSMRQVSSGQNSALCLSPNLNRNFCKSPLTNIRTVTPFKIDNNGDIAANL